MAKITPLSAFASRPNHLTDSCSFALLLCVRVHDTVQEGLTRMDGFQGLGSMLGYLEVRTVIMKRVE